jgi:hypothetical protein
MNCNDAGLNHSVLRLKNVFAMIKTRCIIGMRHYRRSVFNRFVLCQDLGINQKKQTKQNTTNGDQLWVNNNFYW